MDIIDNWSKNIQKVLFPPLCLLCDATVVGAKGVPGMDLCLPCARELPYIEQACRACAVPLPFNRGANQAADLLCGSCLQRQPVFDKAQAVFHYQAPIAGLILGLKFNGRLSHARLLGQLMAAHFLAVAVERVDLLLPVPLHPRRMRQRGFNQSLELARHIGRKLVIPVWADACYRRYDTATQSSLPAKERRRNVRNVFVSRRSLQGRHVAIIDDVMTTGSTANELARVVRRAGARRVDLWVCARVVA